MPIADSEGIIEPILSSELREELNGEYVLDFECPATPDLRSRIQWNSSFIVGDQTFDVGNLSLSMNENGGYTMSVECDHMSYRLNRKEYDIIGYEEYTEDKVDSDGNVIYDPSTGEPVQIVTGNNGGNFRPMEQTSGGAILSALLSASGAPFSGMSIGSDLDFSVSGTRSLRECINDLIEMVAGEVIWDKNTIQIVSRRGDSTTKVVEVGKNLLSLSHNYDRRTRPEEDDPNQDYAEAYEGEVLDKLGDQIEYNIGDSITINDPVLGYSSTQRVVAKVVHPHTDTEVNQITLGTVKDRRKWERALQDTIRDEVRNMDDQGQIGGTGGNEQGPPGPKGDKGDDGLDADPSKQQRQTITNDAGTQSVTAGDVAISFTGTSGTYDLNLDEPQNGMPLAKKAEGNAVGFGYVPKISFSEASEGSGEVTELSSLEATEDGIALKTSENSDIYTMQLKDALPGKIITAKQIDVEDPENPEGGGETKKINGLVFGDTTRISYSELDKDGSPEELSFIEAKEKGILFGNSGEEYTMDLKGAGDGLALTADNGMLVFGTVEGIGHITTTIDQTTHEETSVADTMVLCGKTQIGLKTGNNVFYLDLKNGQEGNMLTADPATQSILFKGFNAANFKGQIQIVQQLPPVEDAEEDTLYIVWGTAVPPS